MKVTSFYFFKKLKLDFEYVDHKFTYKINQINFKLNLLKTRLKARSTYQARLRLIPMLEATCPY